MLQVDIRELARGPVDMAGELAGNDPLFAGLDFVLAGPVQVRGRLQAAGEGRFYWHGRLSAQVAEQCRRCLAPVAVNVAADIGALFTPDPEALEDPESYPLARGRRRSGSRPAPAGDRKSTRLNSSHGYISYAVFCLKKKKKK